MSNLGIWGAVAETPKPFIEAATYPAGGSFGQLLAWHLAQGTRPHPINTKPVLPWIESQFAQSVYDIEPDSPTYEKEFEAAKRTIRNWKNGKIPSNKEDLDKKRVEKVFSLLFGNDANLCRWKADLEEALEFGRRQQAARIANREVVEPQGVPDPTAYFIGRTGDVDEFATMLASPEGPLAVLVQGGPGIGKTELTKALAHDSRVAARFGRRRWFVPLETATSAEAMRYAIVRALGCEPMNGFEGALDMLRDKPALLVLDNLETPWEPIGERSATEAALAVLAAVPGVALLASFRGQEWMKQPKWLTHPLPVLSGEDAGAMFAAIAGPRVQEDLVFNDFMSALGGLPLAIELVARRTHGRASLASLWTEWNRIGAELAQHPDFAEGRLTSLPHSIELSLQSSRATVPALRLLSLLGCLPAGLSAPDLAALMTDDACSAEDRLLALGLAVERPGRITLLPPIREHVFRRHAPDGKSLDKLIQYHTGNMARIYDAGDGCSHEEFDNFEAVLFMILRRGFLEYLKNYLDAFSWISSFLGRSSTFLHEMAIAFHNEGKLTDEADCFWQLSSISYASRDYGLAIKYAGHAGYIYRIVSNVVGQVNCLRMEGRCEEKIHYDYLAQDLIDEDEVTLESRYSQAKNAYLKARYISSDNGLMDYEASCISDLASLDFRCWNHDAAQAGYAEARKLYEILNDTYNVKQCEKTIEQRLEDNEHEC